MTLTGTAAARGLASLLAGCALAGCSPAPDERPPNVLLVSIDTLRADRLSCYGNERRTSPAIDALAEEGVLFTDCEAPTSWTLPAHTTLLTGLPISVHGVCDHRLWTQAGGGGLVARGTFLAERLRALGLETAGFYSWYFLEPQYGFGAGFETYTGVGYSYATLPDVGLEVRRLREAGDLAGARALLEETSADVDASRGNARNVVDAALAWLDTRSGASDQRPFFLFVHLFDVHDPYRPPEPFDRAFDPDYDGAIDGRVRAGKLSTLRADMPARDLEHLLALYDGEIAWTDTQVARLIERLRELQVLDDTLVVVTSDHGEEFFEHGEDTHRKQLFKESVHVPLVLRWPDHLPSGARIDEPVGLIDIAPTVLAAVGAPPGAEGGAALPGRDLAPLSRGELPSDPTTYFTELLTFKKDPARIPRRQFALRYGSERQFVAVEVDGARTAWSYDLARDPRELGPRRPIEPGTPEWTRLEQRLDALRTSYRALRAAAATRPIVPTEAGQQELDALAALGYVDGGAPVASGAGDASSEPERLCFDGCVWDSP